MVSAGARTPDYGHTPASLVNGQAAVSLPLHCNKTYRVSTMETLDGRQWNTVVIIVLN